MGTDEFEDGRAYEQLKQSVGVEASKVEMGETQYSAAQLNSMHELLTIEYESLRILTDKHYPNGNASSQATIDLAKLAIGKLETLMGAKEQTQTTHQAFEDRFVTNPEHPRSPPNNDGHPFS